MQFKDFYYTSEFKKFEKEYDSIISDNTLNTSEKNSRIIALRNKYNIED